MQASPADQTPRARRALERRSIRVLVTLACVSLGAATFPRAFCGRDSNAFFDGDASAQEALARDVAASIEAGVGTAQFHTGSPRFDGEWALVTHQMAALGLAQVALEHPERKEAYRRALERCAERLLDPELFAFGTDAWGASGIDDPTLEHGHAYLGYLNLALGMVRKVYPQTRFASIHDKLTEALARRLSAAPHGLVETYPGETYPADIAAVAGSIGLHSSVSGVDRGGLFDAWARRYRASAVDPRSGLLFHVVDAKTGKGLSAPRGASTALAAYFLSFADKPLARELFAALQTHQRARFLGFGGIREYAPGHDGLGDIDSGPVVFGVSVSATGFSLAGARIFGDRALFTELLRTAELFGVTMHHGERRRFLSGGPLGNAILLAMLTAAREAP